jgi:hypothetical protein
MSSRRLAHGFTIMLAVVALIASATAYAAKQSSYSPTLNVQWPLAAAPTSTSTETPYVINGCGYNAGYGNVTVVVYSPVAAGWTGALPDANGCISLSNFSTQGAGTYRIQAWQHIGKKDVVVASTSFTLS